MNTTLIDAIRTKKVLSLSYDGISRAVEPHTYGANKEGEGLLRCFQVAGGHRNKDGKSHTWDLFSVSKIHSLAATGDTFAGPRPGYKKGDKAMATIYAQL